MKHLKSFNEKFSIGEGVDIKKSIKHLRGVSKENKEIALGLLKSYSSAKKGKITELELHPDLKRKIDEGNYPAGFSMGIDKNGFFIHTHRARSKSYESPSKISVKDIKFIDSTG